MQFDLKVLRLSFNIKILRPLVQLRFNVVDVGPTLSQQLANASVCLLEINPYAVDLEYSRFKSVLSSDQITVTGDEMNFQILRFANAWSEIKQIWVIFTHLKLWIATAIHNFKWVKIKINYLSGKRVKMGINSLRDAPSRRLTLRK